MNRAAGSPAVTARQMCDLCGLDCDGRPIVLHSTGGTLYFCCMGCKGIYLMLHEINAAPDAAAHSDNRKPQA